MGVLDGDEHFECFGKVGFGEASGLVCVHVSEVEGSLRVEENSICSGCVGSPVNEVTGFARGW